MQTKYHLTSFEPENAYSSREVKFISKIQCGERNDYIVASVTPPLEGRFFGKKSDIVMVILAPRHKGVTIESSDNWPIHVYVCVMKKDALIPSTCLSPDDLQIINWGLLDKNT